MLMTILYILITSVFLLYIIPVDNHVLLIIIVGLLLSIERKVDKLLSSNSNIGNKSEDKDKEISYISNVVIEQELEEEFLKRKREEENSKEDDLYENRE